MTGFINFIIGSRVIAMKSGELRIGGCCLMVFLFCQWAEGKVNYSYSDVFVTQFLAGTAQCLQAKPTEQWEGTPSTTAS